MAKTVKKKTKYALNRENQSETAKENRLSVYTYTSNPRTEITISGNISKECSHDVFAAIDEVLKYHGY